MAHVAHKCDLGPLYILGTGFCTNFLNLGRRQPGNVSAYSIFNEDFRELPGTLNADAIDRDIRTEGAQLENYMLLSILKELTLLQISVVHVSNGLHSFQE
ncbi:hypothetical protein V6N11_011039 [Hibiscus sabdariffa]|uniref:SAYSvFN domain-containing protein n=1 Tax=Hibiscus sabdariffa TaxID=183260 RepID=A0ABR2S708_9ROSI